ncbi:MAG TPA: hypothetical protein VK395_35815 [Gemmataceae bacterium]|nr:hypothetical protein [Gemmataceae bacterium]
MPTGSPDCPLVRLYDFTLPEASQLLLAILELANGTSARVAVHELPGVQPVGACQLFLCQRRWDQAMVRTCAPATFECGFTIETWDNVAGLVEPFAQDSSGFQWLAQVPGEAALLLSADGRW